MPIAPGLIAAGALSSAIGAGQAISGARRTEFDRRNEERLNELLGMEKGLSGKQQLAIESSLMAGARDAAAATRRRAEAGGATPGLSGADLSRLRREETAAVGEAGGQAALAVRQADMRAAAAQEQEQAQREAIAETRRQERRASLFGGLSQAAGAAGALAGTVPEALRAAGLAGAPISDTSELRAKLDELGVTGPAADLVMRANPRKLTRAIADAEEYLRTRDPQFLTEDTVDLIRAIEAQRASELGMTPEDLGIAQSINFGAV